MAFCIVMTQSIVMNHTTYVRTTYTYAEKRELRIFPPSGKMLNTVYVTEGECRKYTLNKKVCVSGYVSNVCWDMYGGGGLYGWNSSLVKTCQ